MTNRKNPRAGFEALARNHFGGDESLAAEWVADLGRASFFADTRPLHAGNILAKWESYFPHLILKTEYGPYPRINGQIMIGKSKRN